MNSKPKHQGGSRRSCWYITTIAALLAVGVAGATEIAPNSAPAPSGSLMSFPNVRIVNAAQLAPVAAGQAGLRAYIDPETRALRAPTPEELAQERHDAQANGLLARTMMQEASIHVPIFATATGAIGAMLDESHMLFSVVRIRENGQREEFCVAGPEAAGKLLDTALPPLTVVQRKGDRDER